MDGGFYDALHVGAYQWMAVFINGDGNPQMEATAEGRFLSTGDGNPQMEATAEGRFLSTGMAIRGWRQPPKDGFYQREWQSEDGGNRRRTVV